MVTCLAGSLALVTCKEPLRGALTQHLRQLLQVRAATLPETHRVFQAQPVLMHAERHTKF